MSTLFLDPITDAWTLELADAARAQAWQTAQSQSTPHRRWVAYMNQLCLTAVENLLGIGSQTGSKTGSNLPCSWVADAASRTDIWELVEGSALTVGEHRLILLPTESVDALELAVPQEWVDIPDWAGDYYVAVQLAADEASLRILGYATHPQLKAQGDYDAFDRTYRYDCEDLIPWESFGLIHAADNASQTRTPDQHHALPLATIHSTQAETLIQRLGNPNEPLPRLEIPFDQWGALLAQPSWCQRLGAARRGQAASAVPGRVIAPVTRLSNWLQQQFENGWQPLEGSSRLATRSFLQSRGSQDLEPGEPEEEAIAPRVYTVKPLALSNEAQLLLVLGVTPLRGGDRRIDLSLEPGETHGVLPQATQLRLLSDTGAELGQAQADANEMIEMQFRASPGETFAVEIRSENIRYFEQFEV